MQLYIILFCWHDLPISTQLGDIPVLKMEKKKESIKQDLHYYKF